jgi:hypothetical protein
MSQITMSRIRTLALEMYRRVSLLFFPEFVGVCFSFYFSPPPPLLPRPPDASLSLPTETESNRPKAQSPNNGTKFSHHGVVSPVLPCRRGNPRKLTQARRYAQRRPTATIRQQT